jgi:hypothetical protein
MNDRDGRYATSGLLSRTGSDGRPIVYLERRFLPDPAALTIAGIAEMAAGDRIDLFSSRVQGASTAWWRIADARALIDPGDLETPPLQRLKVPLPEAGR